MTLVERFETDAAVLAGLGMSCVVEKDAAGKLVRWQLELSVTAERVNALGFCHGGYLFAIADTACAYALAETGRHPATIDANVTYLKAARLNDVVVARVEVLRIGRSQGTADVRLLRAEDERLLAVYRGTCVLAETS